MTFRRTLPALRIALALIAAVIVMSQPATADSGFRKWITDFKSTAVKSGIKAGVYDQVFAGVTEPDPEVIEAANFQPEFNAKIWEYVDSRVSDSIIARGRELKAQNKAWLDRIEAKFGVDRHILLAIWSMESSYGEALLTGKGIRSVARSLATLGYADRKRAKFARQQLIAALKIVQNGDVTASGLTGSWAGAMGHTQFIPTSYLTWAVDIDGDGHRNVWTSVPDALASAANLLRKNGWSSGQTWGYEVAVPANVAAKYEDRDGMKVGDFVKLGVRRAKGGNFPRTGDNAVLKMPAGKSGPAFLLTRNFYMLKRYNNADKYALTVGLLADRIAGAPDLSRDWPRGYVLLSEDERKEAQRLLQKQGLYDDEIDGKFGPGTKKAAIAFMARKGVDSEGHPSKTLLQALRGS